MSNNNMKSISEQLKAKKKEGIYEDLGQNGELYNIILSSFYVVNIANSEGFLFLQDKGETLDCNEITLQRVLGTKQAASYRATNYINCVFEYNPHRMAPLFDNGLGLKVYNTYRPPSWQRKHFFFGDQLPSAPTAVPEIYESFLTHLCAGNRASIEYVYDWMATALTERNRTMLVAIGEEGSGKGTFGLLLKELVGAHNYVETRDEVLKRNFNGQLADKRIVYINEVEITGNEQHNRLKNLVNEEIAVEKKGVDERTLNNYASIFLSSNHLNAVKPSPSDRRLSIIQLTDTKLAATPLISRIGELYNPANVEQLALWLLARVPQHNMLVPFRSARFEDVKEASLSEWEHYLVFEWSAKHVGKFVGIREVQSDIKDGMDAKQAPGRVKLSELAKKYPQYLRFNKENGVQGIQVLASPSPAPPLALLKRPPQQ